MADTQNEMSPDKIFWHIPVEQFVQNQVTEEIGLFQFLILIKIACVCRMMRLDEIDPTKVEAAEAAANLETAGYPELRPFLQWVRRSACARQMLGWEREFEKPLRALGITAGPFPVTVDIMGHRYGRFSEFHSLNQFRRQILTSEIDVFFCWNNMCRVVGTHLHHSQSFVVGTLCANIEASLPQFAVHSAPRKCWEGMLSVISTLVCREQRFRWGVGTTQQYACAIRRLIWDANDFALFHIPVTIRNLLRDQVAAPHVVCSAARVTQYDAYLGLVAI